MTTNKKTPLHNETLFSAEEWSRITPGELWYQDPKREQPVTVLGHTFKNDDERRQWFREELRKKLPDLKQMEGYPIGEDDDIINLSDPPYYTACPNPWLNDFIAEWEQEKKQLEAEGKRDADAVVTEPYANDVSEGKNNPIYTAHPYHTKVPHPAIMRYILHYTQPGDIIFDGFAGTGMTGVAASACSNDKDELAIRINGEWLKEFGRIPKWGLRHAICGDLSPYAVNIASFYNIPTNTILLKQEVKRIEKELEDECGWMYTTTNSKGEPKGKLNFMLWSDVMICPNCGKEYVYWKEGVKMINGRVNSLPSYACPYCGATQSKRTAHFATESYFDEKLNKSVLRVKQVPVIVVGKASKEKIQREPNDYDFKILEKIERTKIPYWYPTTALPDGLKTRDPKAREVYYVHQFYTKRTLYVLASLYNKIESSPMAPALRFMFTSLLNLVSKRNRVQAKNPYSRGQGVLNLTLVLPPFPTEASVIEMLDMRLVKMLNAEELIPKVYGNELYVGSADDLSIKDNSIDYIFTDPPFGANINYSELNSMPEPWLRAMTNNSHEAIENEAQGKSATSYRETMTRCFSEYLRVLKPGRWMTVEFSNTSASIWNIIQNALQQAGFIIANVAALDKKQGGMNANMTTTAVKQDLAISCYKPSEKIQNISATNKEKSLWDFVEDHLEHIIPYQVKNGKMLCIVERDPRILYDRVVSYFVMRGQPVPLSSQEFQQELKDRYIEKDGMFFTAHQAAEYEEKKSHTSEFVPMGLIVSDEANGIEWLKHELKEPKTYQEISPEWMAAINGVKKGDMLPELKTILEENFIEDEQGKWHVPDLEKAIDLEKLHHKSLMREFNLYKEQAQKPRARIREVRVEALREGFKECFKDKDFQTILLIADKIPQNILTEDEQLLQYYDIASMRA